MPTAPCPCGGETFVDVFKFGRRPEQWFLRCVACRACSRSVDTDQEAQDLTITPDEAAEATK